MECRFAILQNVELFLSKERAMEEVSVSGQSFLTRQGSADVGTKYRLYLMAPNSSGAQRFSQMEVRLMGYVFAVR
jgi:hypothetical protein